MKRTKEQINVLEKFMVFTAAIGCLSWIVAWVSLIFSVKFALKAFIITGISLALFVLFAMIWGLYLDIYRKKVVKTTFKICDYIKRKENAAGDFKIRLIGSYILCVTFYTPNQLDAINQNKLKATIKDNIPEEFFLVYEEILSE